MGNANNGFYKVLLSIPSNNFQLIMLFSRLVQLPFFFFFFFFFVNLVVLCP